MYKLIILKAIPVQIYFRELKLANYPHLEPVLSCQFIDRKLPETRLLDIFIILEEYSQNYDQVDAVDDLVAGDSSHMGGCQQQHLDATVKDRNLMDASHDVGLVQVVFYLYYCLQVIGNYLTFDVFRVATFNDCEDASKKLEK